MSAEADTTIENVLAALSDQPAEALVALMGHMLARIEIGIRLAGRIEDRPAILEDVGRQADQIHDAIRDAP
jgi:hypothetical protein